MFPCFSQRMSLALRGCIYSWVGCRSVLSTDKLNSRFLMLFLTRAQSYYDCKNLQFTSRFSPARFDNKNIFSSFGKRSRLSQRWCCSCKFRIWCVHFRVSVILLSFLIFCQNLTVKETTNSLKVCLHKTRVLCRTTQLEAVLTMSYDTKIIFGVNRPLTRWRLDLSQTLGNRKMGLVQSFNQSD
jgi:hypothetical protein